MRIRGTAINYEFDNVLQVNKPTLYPGADVHDWTLPEGMSDDFYRLNAILESKYSREYIKICAFYNKMFPSLKFVEDINCTYNVRPFTTIDQERADTGTGISANYLKQITDQITSRLGTIQFVPYLLSEDPNFEFIVYKDEVERILRMYIKKDKFNNKCIRVFHDAAIVGYSHALIDPFTGRLIKVNDYEVGYFESQFNKDNITQLLYRDYGFPKQDIDVYLDKCIPDNQTLRDEIHKSVEHKASVDLCMYFDCSKKTCVVSIEGKFLPEIDYPFNKVLIATMQWDVGIENVTTTSLFDLLYPMQREINKIYAKDQQMVRMYKGATPVFNQDVEIAMKSITNGSGEVLYVDSNRPLDSLMTVINPTPLDPELSAKINEYKTTMYELAGVQNASFDMENMRSAAAVVALDQMRDSIFQAQLSSLSEFIADALKLYVIYNANMPEATNDSIDWSALKNLIDTSYINLEPVHINDMLSDENKVKQEPTDYTKLCTARVVLNIIKGKLTWDDLPYYLDWHDIVLHIAAILIKFEALGIAVPDCIHKFLICAFVESVKEGEIDL